MNVFVGAIDFAKQAAGWECIVDDHPEDSLTRKKTNPLPYQGILGRISQSTARAARRAGVPVVNVWASTPAKNVPSVLADHAAAGDQIAQHLLARGFRNFATLGVVNDRGFKLEAERFRGTVMEQGFPCLPQLETLEVGETLSQRRSLRNALEKWIDQWRFPIGIYAGTEYLGRLIAQLCLQREYQVPGEVAILAGHNQENLCENPAPSLSSLEFGYERIGFKAAELLDLLMKGGTAPRKPILIPPVGVAARASTDFTVVNDPLVTEALRYIASHSHQPITVNNVVSAAATSRSTLERRFRSQMGRPIAAEIRRLRIERAMRSLEGTDEALFEIALECGFPGATQFSRIFRQIVGVTPSEYRRQKRN